MRKSTRRERTGEVVGRLTLLECVGAAPRVKNKQPALWKCRCECGVEKVLSTDSLRRVASCGCLRRDRGRAMMANRPRRPRAPVAPRERKPTPNLDVIRALNPVRRSAFAGLSGRQSRVGRKRMDLVGATYGALTVVDRAPGVTSSRASKWNCRCTCGEMVVVGTEHLRRSDRPKRNCGKCGRWDHDQNPAPRQARGGGIGPGALTFDPEMELQSLIGRMGADAELTGLLGELKAAAQDVIDGEGSSEWVA